MKHNIILFLFFNLEKYKTMDLRGPHIKADIWNRFK